MFLCFFGTDWISYWPPLRLLFIEELSGGGHRYNETVLKDLWVPAGFSDLWDTEESYLWRTMVKTITSLAILTIRACSYCSIHFHLHVIASRVSCVHFLLLPSDQMTHILSPTQTFDAGWRELFLASSIPPSLPSFSEVIFFVSWSTKPSHGALDKHAVMKRKPLKSASSSHQLVLPRLCTGVG